MKKYRPRVVGVPTSARIGVVLPPLVDINGDPFDHLPCADAPLDWDEDADRATKRRSAAICRSCPALIACEARLYQIGKRRAVGVWAGHILTDTGDNFPNERDPLVVRWARQAGIELPPVPK